MVAVTGFVRMATKPSDVEKEYDVMEETLYKESMKALVYFDRTEKKERETQVFWDESIFSVPSTELYDRRPKLYQHMALASVILSNNIYEHKNNYLHKTLETLGVKINDENAVILHAEDMLESTLMPMFAFANTKIHVDGKEQVLIFIVIRGSDRGSEVFANVAGSFAYGFGHPREHLAHSYAKKHILRALTAYFETLDDFLAIDTKFLITGHSYGGAASNLIAKQLEDTFPKDNIYCFTFGAPDTIIVPQLGKRSKEKNESNENNTAKAETKSTAETESEVKNNTESNNNEAKTSLASIENADRNIHNIRNRLDHICLISDLIPLVSETYTMYGLQHWFAQNEKWYEHLPIIQLAATKRHHYMASYINFILSSMDEKPKRALPIRYNGLYAFGTMGLPLALPLGAMKLKKKVSKTEL
jgi:esterase/lipase